MTDSRVENILEAFETFDGVYKRSEVGAAVKLQEQITPHLLRVLEQVLSEPHKYANEQDYYTHIYALVLLGHFKEQRAHRTIVELFSLPTDLPHQLFGDIVTENGPIILLRTCGGSTECIKSLVLNKKADDYCRSSAMRAMVFAVAKGMEPRETVLALFSSLFTGNEADCDSPFWSFLASAVCDLYPEGMMEIIRQAYQDKLISPGIIGPESFQRTLAEGRERTVERVRARIRRRSPKNVHDYMSWWACFSNQQPSLRISAFSGKRPAQGSPGKRKVRRRKIRKRKRNARKRGRR